MTRSGVTVTALVAAIGVLVAALLVAFASFARPGSAAAQEQPLVVRAGDGEGGYAINRFLPESFTVAVGTTVRWEFPWFEPHTVTFGTPQSGAPASAPSPATYDGTSFLTSDLIFGPDKRYEIVFTTPGTYTYYCITHPFMTGEIAVVEEGELQDQQSDLDERADAQYEVAVTELRAIAEEWAAQEPARRTLPDGTTEHEVTIAGATRFGDVQLFFPLSITVIEGDTVRWHSIVSTPHTATFGPFPAGLAVPENPAIAEVARPGDSYEGTGYWNSGVIGVDWPLGRDFSMRFTKPGSYVYYCVLHDTQGMTGEVVVLPAAGGDGEPTPVAPDAGSGTASGAEPRATLARLVLVTVAAGGVVAVVALSRRRPRGEP